MRGAIRIAVEHIVLAIIKAMKLSRLETGVTRALRIILLPVAFFQIVMVVQATIASSFRLHLF